MFVSRFHATLPKKFVSSQRHGIANCCWIRTCDIYFTSQNFISVKTDAQRAGYCLRHGKNKTRFCTLTAKEQVGDRVTDRLSRAAFGTIAGPVHELLERLLQVARQESRSVKPLASEAMEYVIALSDELERPL